MVSCIKGVTQAKGILKTGSRGENFGTNRGENEATGLTNDVTVLTKGLQELNFNQLYSKGQRWSLEIKVNLMLILITNSVYQKVYCTVIHIYSDLWIVGRIHLKEVRDTDCVDLEFPEPVAVEET